MIKSQRYLLLICLVSFVLGCKRDNPVTPNPDLGAPELLTPSNGGTVASQTFACTWKGVSGALWYRIQVSNKANFSTVLLDTTSTTTTCRISLVDTGTYYWRVCSQDSSRASAWSDVWSFTTGLSLGIPQLIAPPNGTTSAPLTPILSWNKVTDALAYRVQVSTKSDFSTLVEDTVVGTTSITGLPLTAATTYYWRVRAQNWEFISQWSNTWSFTTQAPVYQPTIGSSYIVMGCVYDQTTGVLRPDGNRPDTMIVSQTGLSYSGRSNVTKLVYGDTNTPYYIQYKPNGDVSVLQGPRWFDMPIASHVGFRDTVYNPSMPVVYYTVSYAGPVSVTVGGQQYTAQRIVVADTSTWSQAEQYWDWIPSIGFWADNAYPNESKYWGWGQEELLGFKLK